MTDAKAKIAQLLTRWNHAVQTEDPDKVVALYAPDAILLPTVSAKVRHNHEEIRDYFVHFLSKKPVGTVIEQNIRLFGDIAVNSGLYNFCLFKAGVTTAAARFSFVYRRSDSQWLIIEHHSSLLPEE